MTNHVALLEITQATTATFTDLYFQLTFLFFIESGSKRVLCPRSGELIGEEGDLMLFPPGVMVTMENRPVMDRQYRAVGVSFSDTIVRAVFSEDRGPALPSDRAAEKIQIVRAAPEHPAALLPVLRDTIGRDDLPEPIRDHRLVEPLVWLRHRGLRLSPKVDATPLGRVRSILQTDLSREWRAGDVADRLATSEPTMRRALAKSGQGFAKILLHTRLERALSRLQTSSDPISEIALDVGFKTPSHFADAFRQRFGISPRRIRDAAP